MVQYKDEYYEIQKMNNQLINSQRALMKSNQRLKQALADIRNANDTIALLERDELTGLCRMSAFYRKVKKRVAKHPGQPFDVIVLNIEHFVLVNDLFGRKASEQLVQSLALFLSGMEHTEEGVIARSSGDLFYLYMPADPQQERFCDVLVRELDEFFGSYPLPVRLAGRIGVCPGDETIPVEQLCDRARLALDTVNGQGRAKIAFYNHELHEKLLLEHRIFDSVQGALKNREFQCYLQPKVDMSTGEMVGAEALIRWISPEMGFIPPDKFIPLLEKEGGIYAVDQFIWEEACRFLRERKERGLEPMRVSVNLARADLYQPDLPQVLDNLLKKYGLAPQELNLEIIERDYTGDTEHMFEILTGLRDRGFLIEMDDFGVGESSLAMAAEMPVDVLKLDRMFLVKNLHSELHVAVIRLILELAKTLGMKVIAEGVETQEQADLLLSLGCRYAQGYFYGRPEPAENFLKQK